MFQNDVIIHNIAFCKNQLTGLAIAQTTKVFAWQISLLSDILLYIFWTAPRNLTTIFIITSFNVMFEWFLAFPHLNTTLGYQESLLVMTDLHTLELKLLSQHSSLVQLAKNVDYIITVELCFSRSLFTPKVLSKNITNKRDVLWFTCNYLKSFFRLSRRQENELGYALF